MTGQQTFASIFHDLYQTQLLLVSRTRDYGKESCIRLVAFAALRFPLVVTGIRNSAEIARGLLIATLLDELNNALRHFRIENRFAPSRLFFHLPIPSTAAKSRSTA